MVIRNVLVVIVFRVFFACFPDIISRDRLGRSDTRELALDRAERMASVYEREREARIKRNKERLQELNLPSLFDSFQATLRRNNGRKQLWQPRIPKPQSLAESRRSSRLANLEPAEYNEAALESAEAYLGQRRTNRQSDERYTQEHLKALGDYKEAWVLFVDGYDGQGNRVYSKEAGLTCHQCRQKTLGQRTTCSSCKSLRGVFCGDCLFMRYGENVREANANPAWVCPACRDLCNCSIHRVRRGWTPTGSMYRQAVAQGFKSVAHYLVLNNLVKPEETAEPVPAKPAKGLEDVDKPKAKEISQVLRTDATPRPTPKKAQAQQKRLSNMLQPRKKQSTKDPTVKAGQKGLKQAVRVREVGLRRATRSTIQI